MILLHLQHLLQHLARLFCRHYYLQVVDYFIMQHLVMDLHFLQLED